jgi:hypothetical protein
MYSVSMPLLCFSLFNEKHAHVETQLALWSMLFGILFIIVIFVFYLYVLFTNFTIGKTKSRKLDWSILLHDSFFEN